ncbi:uncharacterized protein si:dkey-9i23.16 [Mugil cephalus]|uniref:uncharacterized protein si:dkey-9i23.16 n=1 Tax=Mugil cephalus TaxID=48193 RepID=UPI001FB58A79|nr:uncharacterized protein si:dkey-9i23.16 [Mugil cephalus]
MASVETQPSAEFRLHRLAPWFDPESAAVTTILLGLFQVLLAASVAQTDEVLPKLFVLPLVSGLLIVAGGSLTVANERNPSRLLLRGCACSNGVGLLGALLAFCLYCYTLSLQDTEEECPSIPHEYYYQSFYSCPPTDLAKLTSSVTLLLLLYDTGAAIMHCLLSVSAFKTLKTD